MAEKDLWSVLVVVVLVVNVSAVGSRHTYIYIHHVKENSSTRGIP